MKKIFLVLSVVVLMVCLCSCNKGQAKIDRMIDYMNNKYSDDTFTYLRMSGGFPGSNETKIVVASEKYPDIFIRVICAEVDGAEIFTDTYVGAKFEEQTREYLEDVIRGEYGDNFSLHYTPSDIVCTENGSSDTTFEEFLSTTKISFSAVVYAENGIVDEAATEEVIKKMFADSVISFGCIFYVDDEVLLSDDSYEEEVWNCIHHGIYIEELVIWKESPEVYSKLEWKYPQQF